MNSWTENGGSATFRCRSRKAADSIGAGDLSRARVICAEKGRSSWGMPHSCTASCIRAARSTRHGSGSTPIQITRGCFRLGKQPAPLKFSSKAVAWICASLLLSRSTASCSTSPRNARVRCTCASGTHRAPGISVRSCPRAVLRLAGISMAMKSLTVVSFAPCVQIYNRLVEKVHRASAGILRQVRMKLKI